jgi:tRNA G46 methylase TrmB
MGQSKAQSNVSQTAESGEGTSPLPASVNPYEQRLAEHPDIARGGGDVFASRGSWLGHFRHRVGPTFDGRIVLEVGSADATFLVDVAAKHPTTGFVGLDWKFKQVHDGAARVSAAGLRNVALLRGRADDLSRMFAPGELDEVWVFHPEPCAEPKQRANRLVAEPFLLAAHDLLRGEGSVVAVKTDHAGYYQWVHGVTGTEEPAAFRLAREAAAAGTPAPEGTPRVRVRDLLAPDDVPVPSAAVGKRFVVAASSPDFWRDEAVLRHTAGRCFAGSRTPFERRFVDKRRPIYYVELRRR